MTKQQKTVLIIAISILSILGIIIGWMFITYFFGNEQAQAPIAPPGSTAIPTATQSSAATATIVPETRDPVWENIKSQNKMVVGISADYPPYAFVDTDFIIKGYDLALIEEIGRRLNLNLDIRNMAFDGLISAVQLGQIDVAIAAISVSPERDGVIDFSNVYYVGDEAILAHKDANIQINVLYDMNRYRVGVQRGSVYESWVRDNLVDPGFMPPRHLVTYNTPQDALSELVKPNPPIDIVVMDFQPAEIAIRSAPVKIVAKQLNPQRYAIAIPQGSVFLQQNLNQVLSQLQNEGFLAALAKQYLNVDNLPPLPTAVPPQPTATPAPEVCLDGMAFIQDLNYPDNNMQNLPQFQPGAAIQKGWRIRNTGTCTWDSSYTLSYLNANPPNAPVGGNPVPIQGRVSPGQTYDVYVNITAPWQPGSYQSFWSMRNPNGLYFGDRVYAGIRVVAQATPTPPPQAPVIISFIASPFTISQGQCVALSWQYQGRDLVMTRLFRNNDVILMDMPTSGVYNDCPMSIGQVQYRLLVDSEFAGSAQAAQVVNVLPVAQPTPTPQPTPEQPPVISYFAVDPIQISQGECVNLSWSFSGSSLVSTGITRNGELIASDVAPSSSMQDCPPTPGSITYRLSVSTEFAGSAHSEQYLMVYPQVAPDEPPVITYFNATPTQVYGSDVVTLSWSFSGTSLVSAVLMQDGQVIASDVSTDGSFQVMIDPSWEGRTINFSLKVDSETDSTQADVQVEVLVANG